MSENPQWPLYPRPEESTSTVAKRRGLGGFVARLLQRQQVVEQQEPKSLAMNEREAVSADYHKELRALSDEISQAECDSFLYHATAVLHNRAVQEVDGSWKFKETSTFSVGLNSAVVQRACEQLGIGVVAEPKRNEYKTYKQINKNLECIQNHTEQRLGYLLKDDSIGVKIKHEKINLDQVYRDLSAGRIDEDYYKNLLFRLEMDFPIIRDDMLPNTAKEEILNIKKNHHISQHHKFESELRKSKDYAVILGAKLTMYDFLTQVEQGEYGAGCQGVRARAEISSMTYNKSDGDLSEKFEQIAPGLVLNDLVIEEYTPSKSAPVGNHLISASL